MVALLVVGRVSATGSAACIDPAKLAQSAYQIPISGIELSLIALTISFDVVAVAVMINRLMPGTGIGGWINNEYWEIAKSVMLVAGIYALLTFISSIALIINPLAGITLPGSNQVGLGSPSYGNGGYNNNIYALLQGTESYLCAVNWELYNATYAISQMSNGIKLLQNPGIGVGSGLQIGLYTPVPIPLPPAGYAFLFGFTAFPYASLILDSGSIIIGVFASPVRDALQFLLFPMISLVIVLE
ncbi:MAG: hypothetical protein KGH50_01460, partial [Candidatus Micrarchaeota archaeon]|nr:hypothetical protein [Candidatus Micrarchaeota archaeon]